MIPDAHPLLVFSVILLAGLLAGRISHLIRLPHVTGQIIVGILLGHSVLNLFPAAALEGLDAIMEFALGFMALTIGEHLNLRAMRNMGRRLVILLIAESVLVPVVVIAASAPITGSVWLPLLLGTMAVSTAPATVVALVKESRSKGVFVKTLIAAVALNNISCIVLFSVAVPVVQLGVSAPGSGGILSLLGLPALKLLASVALGAAAGAGLVSLTRHELRPSRQAAATSVALLLVCGLASYLHLSLLLACLSLGVIITNLTADSRTVGIRVLENIEPVIFAVFFTLAGMEVDLHRILGALLLSLVVIGARAVGKLASSYLAMRVAAATAPLRRYLGIALIPQAGITVGQVLLVQTLPGLEPLRDAVLDVGLACIMVNELVGSLTAHVGLRKSGEVGKDRPRLMDFIQEQHIVTGFSADGREDAVRKLTDLLARTRGLKLDRDAVVKGILRRQLRTRLSVRGGLAVVHTPLPEGASLAGVMALARDGVRLGARWKPVHCLVLLGFPKTESDRHLQVRTALERWIRRTPDVRDELFRSDTPAHAHDVLHSDDTEDFNYYLTAE